MAEPRARRRRPVAQLSIAGGEVVAGVLRRCARSSCQASGPDLIARRPASAGTSCAHN